MMKKLKVMTVVGTRPEIIRLSRVLAKLDEHCEHVLVHTGQNYDYELNQIFFDDLGVRKPDHFLNSAANATGAAHTIGNLIIGVDKVLDEVQPEAMLVLGDTNSCLSVIPAKRRKIPIFHMEAGNRCFDQRVPEETNRRIVDHTADVNLTYSSIARDYLLREGLPPDLVIKTGSPMFEVLTHYRPNIDASDVLARLELVEGGYFVVSAHREENIESPQSFAKLVDVLNAVAEDHGLPVIVSTHPLAHCGRWAQVCLASRRSGAPWLARQRLAVGPVPRGAHAVFLCACGCTVGVFEKRPGVQHDHPGQGAVLSDGGRAADWHAQW
jgi:UDP-N-acetylglucosamine 2-epimerase (non-hydrolysing)